MFIESNLSHENQPHGVSRGYSIPYQPIGVSRGWRRDYHPEATGANARRLIAWKVSVQFQAHEIRAGIGPKGEILIFNLNSKIDLDKPRSVANPLLHATCASVSYFRSFSFRCHPRSTAEPCFVADDVETLSRRWRRVRTGANAHRLIGMPQSEIVAQGYDLSINRYKEVVHEEVDHRAPQAILDELENIEKEITQGMKQLRGMIESGK